MSDSGALLGRVVAGKFMIEELVGSGAMGEVFRARHVVLDTMIALKIMRADIAKDAMFKERFYREAKAASRLDHPNSVRVLDFGVEEDGLVYLAMEFLQGRDLLSVLREEWPLPDARIVDIVSQALAAVSVAHELGIVHRDLKPENIMVSIGPEDDGARPYHVKVCDFGIAKLNDPRGFQTDAGKALTSSGTLIGTPEYMSPEQARGDALDARSDVYSVGIVLYQLLVGRVPFTAENALGVVLKQVTDEPVAPSTVRPGVNPRLEAICLRALKKPRDERYQTAKEMRRNLKAVFGYRAQNHTDESSPNLLVGRALDDSSGRHIVHSGAESAQTLLAPVAPSDVDFAPKGTSDGTEVTVPLTPTHRYLPVIAAVAVLALLVGAASVFLFGRRTDAANGDPASASASASAASAGSAATVGSALETSEPTSPPLALAGSAAKGKVGGPNGGKHGAVAASASAGRASGPATATTAAGATTTTTTTKASASPPPVADPNYNPAGAFVSLGGLTRERVREDAIRQKMSAMLPKLSECYRSALMTAGAPVGGSAEIHMSIDDKGAVTPMVNAPKLPQFARCAQGALVGQRVPVSALEDATAGANASQWLDLHP